MSRIPDELRRQVETRANGLCEYCRVPVQGQVAWFPIDHIRPRSVGGETELNNLAFACPRCNAHKWAHTEGEDAVTGDDVPLYNPRTQTWEEHFEWSKIDPFHIDGKTPSGRATVTRLRMNDTEIVTIRRLLVELGLMVLSF